MPELSEEQWRPIEADIFGGRKIQAVKQFRQAAGCDLKAAKDAVEQREKNLRAASPEKFTRSGGGCVGVLVLMAVAVAVLTTFLIS